MAKEKKIDLKKKLDMFMSETFQEEKLEAVLGDRFGRYSKYIIQERAIPDARDGLKPVQRRILYSMHREKNTYDKGYRKSAKTVGDVIGNLTAAEGVNLRNLTLDVCVTRRLVVFEVFDNFKSISYRQWIIFRSELWHVVTGLTIDRVEVSSLINGLRRVTVVQYYLSADDHLVADVSNRTCCVTLVL